MNQSVLSVWCHTYEMWCLSLCSIPTYIIWYCHARPSPSLLFQLLITPHYISHSSCSGSWIEIPPIMVLLHVLLNRLLIEFLYFKIFAELTEIQYCKLNQYLKMCIVLILPDFGIRMTRTGSESNFSLSHHNLCCCSLTETWSRYIPYQFIKDLNFEICFFELM